MNIFSAAALGIVGVLLALTIKKIRPELALMISLATGLIIMIDVFKDLFTVFEQLKSIAEVNGIDGSYFAIAIKACVIAYVTQFSAELCKDAGEGAVGVKIEFAGKLAIVTMSLPVISGFLNSVSDLLGKI